MSSILPADAPGQPLSKAVDQTVAYVRDEVLPLAANRAERRLVQRDGPKVRLLVASLLGGSVELRHASAVCNGEGATPLVLQSLRVGVGMTSLSGDHIIWW